MSKSPDIKPYIFDAQFPLEPIPPGFNAVKLSLECRMRSSLDWKMAREAAQKLRQEGYKIFWELRLGLFGDLDLPLDSEMQFKSLCLGIEHFVMDLWKEFEECSLGVFFIGDRSVLPKGFHGARPRKRIGLHGFKRILRMLNILIVKRDCKFQTLRNVSRRAPRLCPASSARMWERIISHYYLKSSLTNLMRFYAWMPAANKIL